MTIRDDVIALAVKVIEDRGIAYSTTDERNRAIAAVLYDEGLLQPPSEVLREIVAITTQVDDENKRLRLIFGESRPEMIFAPEVSQ